MLTAISLKNFKCFNETCSIPMAQVTVLYGKNGRGKSTVVQSLLLLSQTMKECNDVRTLQLMGKLISLGAFDDVLNSEANEKEFEIGLVSDTERVELSYTLIADKPQLAQLMGLTVNGVERLDVNASEDGQNISEHRVAGAISDIKELQALKDLAYIAADRRGPVNAVMRRDALADSWLGTKGEYLINVLAQNDADFLTKVESALSKVLSGASIKINNKDSERVELYLNSVDGKKVYRPVNVGFGYSYVLPIIVLALLSNEGGTIVIENPEAHLHPGAQSRLMEFLVDTAKQRNLQIVIESHSDHIVNGLRLAVKTDLLKENEALINYFSRDTVTDVTEIEQIYVDGNGELSSYPDDFMDEWTKQLLELIKK